MSARFPLPAVLPAALVVACVPAGNSTPSDSAAPAPTLSTPATIHQSPRVLKTVFEDNFDRKPASEMGHEHEHAHAVPSASASVHPSALPSGSASASADNETDELGPDWYQSNTNVWHIEDGKLCGAMAHNHGVWLQRPIPVNARIEFDAVSDSADGDLKAEVWGDGQSSATSISYTNATSYLTIFGGWHNTFNVLARMNEHGRDRKEIRIDKDSDDPREKPVTGGQTYHFKIERNDGKTVKWYVDGLEYLEWADNLPLVGIGHDHFGFNDWEVKVCFDNVKVTPLP